MKSIMLEDILTYRFLSDVKYAPDGKHAAFTLGTANKDENNYERCLYLWDGHEIRQMTSIGKEGTFVWENSSSLLFPAVRSAAEKKRAEAGEPFTSWYRLNLTGGEALPAFSFPFACIDLIPLDQGKYGVLGVIDRHIPDYYQMTDEARNKVLADRKADKDYEVLDEIPFWGNGEGFTNGNRIALFIYNSTGNSLERITAPQDYVEHCVQMNGRLYCSVTCFDKVYPLHGTRVDEYDPATGTARTVATDEKLAGGALITMGNTLCLLSCAGERHGLNENR